MKVKKTLAILTLPFMCLLSSCKEESLVYGTKSIFERPANYQGLYWFGDKVDINDDSLYMLSTSDDEIDPCNYSRLFAESKYVYESGQIPYVSSVYYLYYYSAFPSVIYKITRGYGGHYRSNGQYFVTGISIKTFNVKSLYEEDENSKYFLALWPSSGVANTAKFFLSTPMRDDDNEPGRRLPSLLFRHATVPFSLVKYEPSL